MAADVARNLSAAGRKADQGHILELQGIDHCGEVISVVVHVVALPGLGRAAMAATVVRNHAVPLGG
ncbi:hypothetical protein D3C71_1576270 [compost metagenome]